MKLWWTLLCLLLFVNEAALCADKLVILSPHRKSIQEEFIPLFEKYYKEKYKTDVVVDWLDQGGTSDDIRFLRARHAKNPKAPGIDIFWGGGTSTFLELSRDNLLQPLDLPAHIWKDIPASAAGTALADKDKTWIATALSSFGILYNKKILKMEKRPEPQTWEDLAAASYFNNLSAADPRRSGTAGAMNQIVLAAFGWQKGWEILTATAGNIRQFTHSSSDPIKAVVSGDAVAAMAIDFYAFGKINELGADKLGFILPKGQTVLDPDPIAIVKGAANKQVASRFIEFILRPETQQILMLPVGEAGGPTRSYLGRMAVHPSAYKLTDGKRVMALNPFEQKSYLKIDNEKAGKLRRIFDDLLGATHIDTHRQLKDAWKSIVKGQHVATQLKMISVPPVTEAELLKLSEKWGDDVFRNQTINKWVEAAQKKYKDVQTQPKAG